MNLDKEYYDFVGGDKGEAYEEYDLYGGMPLVISKKTDKFQLNFNLFYSKKEVKKMTTAKGKKKSTGKKSAKTSNRTKYLWLIPVVIWMGFIFYMSQNTGTSSGSLSLKITEKFVSLLNVIRKDTVSEQAQMVTFMHPIIRKLAHMCEYAILLLLMVPAVKAWRKSGSKGYTYALSFILTFIYACTDELHQLFVSGRAGKCTDVFIDSIGAAIALLMVMATGNSKWRIIAWFIFAMVIVACFLFLILYKI